MEESDQAVEGGATASGLAAGNSPRDSRVTDIGASRAWFSRITRRCFPSVGSAAATLALQAERASRRMRHHKASANTMAKAKHPHVNSTEKTVDPE